MSNYTLLKRIYDNSNQSIFRLEPLPWNTDKINDNIITALKRRIDVSGFQSVLKYSELSVDEKEEVLLLKEEDLIIEIQDYLVITEYGMLYLNYKMELITESEIARLSQKKMIEVINENLNSRCQSVFVNQISNKESVLGLFLLLNGVINEKSKLKLSPSDAGGYLHGEQIIEEINNIYSAIINDDEQTLIKDEKEFRNIIGRIGKNGRFAKVFPQYYNRDSDSIWFEFSKTENVLLAYKNVLKTLFEVLYPKNRRQNIINNMLVIIEKYMISNPLEPYILKDIFSHSNNFDTLLKIHAATKSLLDDLTLES